MVKLYSQRDIRWRDKEIAPGYKFGSFGHLTTCIAMMASLAGYKDTPFETAKKLQEAGIYVGRFITYLDRIPEVYPKLTWNGLINWHNTTDLHRLKTELAIGPVILQVGLVPGGARVPRSRHYVIGEKLTKNDLKVIDPWTGTRCQFLERYAIDEWDIKKVILRAFLLRVSGD